MRPRRDEMEEVLGRLPMPHLEAGQYLVDLLFKVGPVQKEAPLDEQMLESWERRRGVQLRPWEAEVVVEMSRAYLSEMYAARALGAQPAWKPAAAMWRFVRDKIDTPRLRDALADKVKDGDGPRKRH
jgi:hypothetical protein